MRTSNVMRLRLSVLALSLLALLALASPSSAQGVTVSIIDNDYDPATIAVATGSEVTWINRGALLHDVVGLRGEFRSRRFRTGESFSFVFNEPGTFDYQCTVHWSMSGTVEVRGAPVAASQPSPTPSPTPAAARRFSPSFELGGAVARPRTYSLDDLRALPSDDIPVEFLAAGQPQRRTYRGVRLLELVNVAGSEVNRALNNDALRLYITVTATDGYAAVIAWGEIDPGFEGKPVLVAYEEDGQLLGDADGMARLVVPGDQRGGRYVSNITAISVDKAGNGGR